MQPNTLYSSANPDFHKDIYLYTHIQDVAETSNTLEIIYCLHCNC